jgi:hypothetical protein
MERLYEILERVEMEIHILMSGVVEDLRYDENVRRVIVYQ